MDHALDCGFNPQWLEKGKSSKQQEQAGPGRLWTTCVADNRCHRGGRRVGGRGFRGSLERPPRQQVRREVRRSPPRQQTRSRHRLSFCYARNGIQLEQNKRFNCQEPARRRSKTTRAQAASSLLALPAPPANPEAQSGQAAAARREEIIAQLRVLQEQLRQTSQESTGRGHSLPSPPRTQLPQNDVFVPPPPPPPLTQPVSAEVAAPDEQESAGSEAPSNATTLVMLGVGVVHPPTNEVLEEDDQPCMFCREALPTTVDESENAEALPCGYSFHKRCIQRSIEVTIN